MSDDLQIRFKELAQAERVFVGRVPSQNDLCALFTVRSTMFYLRSGGRIAFVLPLAALTRGQFEKLRKGSFTSAKIAWDEAWTMNDDLRPLFPVPSCVVFGRRRATAKAMPNTVHAYAGLLPLRDAPESIADRYLSLDHTAPALAVAQHRGGSVYRDQFRNGATLFPRMLCFVERKNVGRLGSDPRAPFVTSRRSTQEKKPWKLLPALEHRVEAEFIYPVLLGESILPYRIYRPFETVLPISTIGEMLDAQGAANRGFSELNGWMNLAEKLWEDNKRSDMTLVQMFDYFGQLTAQFPVRPLRVFNLPIPRFDASQSLHSDLVAAAAEAERIAAAFELSETVKFQRARKLIRDALIESGVTPHIDDLVARLLDQAPVSDDGADNE